MSIVHKRKRLTSFQIIIFGFALVILMGSFLLMLPISTQDGGGASFYDALFTSTSAVCVTGLVVHDTATYWSSFGQTVILALIQIGGMGVVTVAVSLAVISGRKIDLMQRSTMQEAISAPQMGGIVRLTEFILKMTFVFEVTGALVMLPVFASEFGVKKGIWYAVFHSISAFCNAGFDLMGEREKFSSLTSFSSEPVINLTVMALIVIGGIGFLTWDDIREKKLHLRRYRMQSKVILTVTLLLILVPAVYFYFGELTAAPVKERIWGSLFQSVTPRTAGFNTVDLTTFSEAGIAIMIVLMIIGGSPGSTAGGMKTTTIAVLFASASAVFYRREDAHFFNRRIPIEVIRNAAAILLMYLVLFFGGGLVISRVENLPLLSCLFETASAIGTVGLSLGLTPDLGLLSRGILVVLMFFGRVGGLTLIFAAVSGTKNHSSRLPQEKITVG
ncbi:MAG: potassium transporter TrkG [Lachnospiraceae bacterium]|nr:potassium transporter TrkG [Lachnospiraceae bacterium]